MDASTIRSELMIAYRPEIDGLRAIAVLGVLLFHAGFPAFSGGYAGVDVFFVISGYLITRTILTGIDAGQFSYVGFFVNRVRRLFPSFLATIGVSFLAGALLFSPPYLKRLGEAAITSVLCISNIYFWSEADYWDIESTFKPLLHTWSLSVEEQFYFVWPPLLILVSRAKCRRIIRIALVAIVGLTSLFFAGALSPDHPRATFYWMPWRAFEFMIGAAVIWLEIAEYARPALARRSQRLADWACSSCPFWRMTIIRRSRFPARCCRAPAPRFLSGSAELASRRSYGPTGG